MSQTAEFDSSKEPANMKLSRFEIYCKRLGINPHLLMLKVTLFMMYGASASLLPFLTIHMQSIGLTVEEIAIIYLALPLTTFLSPPITGFLVDKFGHYKSVVIFSLLFNGIFHHALTFIPQMEIPGETPVAYVLRHPQNGKVEVWWSPCPSRGCPEDEELNLVLDSCLDHCLMKNTKNTLSFLAGIHESIAVKPPTFLNQAGAGCGHSRAGHGHDEVPSFGVIPGDLRKKKKGQSSAKNVTLAVGNATMTRMLNSSTSQPSIILNKSNNSDLKNQFSISSDFITASSVNTTLNATTPGTTPSTTTTTPAPRIIPEEVAFFLVDMFPDLGAAVEHLGLEMEMNENETVADFRQHFSKDLLVSYGVNFTAMEEADLRCGGFVVATNLTYDTLKELAADCMLQVCQFREGGPEVCPPDYKPSGDHVFWTYFALRFLATTMLSASVTVMDPIALTMVQQYGGEFGRERLFSTIGMAIFSPLSGVLIDLSSKKLGYTDYSAAFYTYSGLLTASALSVLLMPIGAKLPADNLMGDLIHLLKLPHVLLFILFMFVLGNCWGFIESYLFLYLKELGASNYLLGITVSIGTLSSIPFLYGAESITKKIGHVNIIIIAFFAHAARLTGYSYINEAWWCFPFEAIESLAVHLMWVAAATYCAVLAPKTLLATLIGVLGMAHFSLGRGSGSFFGGLLIGTFGTREAFRLMGVVSVVGGIMYGILHFFWLHKYSENEIKDKGDSSEVEKLNSEKDDVEKADKNEKEEELSKSLERLSLIIRFNHRGSLTSLTDTARAPGSRRNSSSVEVKKLLKSALEGSYRNSNPQLRMSTPQLTKPLQKNANDNADTPQPARRNKSPAAPKHESITESPGSEGAGLTNNIARDDDGAEEKGPVCRNVIKQFDTGGR